MLLFSPAFRAYTLRFLLLSNIATIIFVAYPSLSVTPSRRAITFIVCSLITLHHILVFRLAVSLFWYIFFTELGLLALLLSGLFRAATIMQCKAGLPRQPFSFLGGCTPVHPPCTPLSTLLGRSISRPLVRGEAMAASIVFARAVIINQSVCAPAILLPFIDFIWVVPQFAQESMVITTFQLPSTKWYASRQDSATSHSTRPLRIFTFLQMETPTQFVWYYHRVAGPRMPISVPDVDPAEIHWLRVCVKADDRYGRDGDLDEEAGEDADAHEGVMAGATTGGARLTRLTPGVNEYGTTTKLLAAARHNPPLRFASFGGLSTFINTVPPTRRRARAAARDAGAPVAPGLPRAAFRGRRAEEAGIIAFIRERLVDIGDDPRLDGKDTDIGANDVEAQTGAGSDERGVAGTDFPEEEGTDPELGGPADPATFQPHENHMSSTDFKPKTNHCLYRRSVEAKWNREIRGIHSETSFREDTQVKFIPARELADLYATQGEGRGEAKITCFIIEDTHVNFITARALGVPNRIQIEVAINDQEIP
ncbi:hypothetical protein B0H16DRAFT_1471952 [Mycena metata]|uniref:Uncharacterized protein n=1 Tax=Mycena metata TaxID=1033252 RepID=A0AAD7HP94_9AGAR|nr:hypothetical protein B0H16DRAFT_1471952 [Mycena metata]